MTKRLEADVWEVDVTAQEGWTVNGEKPLRFPGADLLLELSGVTELEIVARWFEYLMPLSRALKPGLVVGDWRYEPPEESPVNMGSSPECMPRHLVARVFLPAGHHTVRFEARRDAGPHWAAWGYMKGTTDMPFQMRVKIVNRFKGETS